MHITQMDEGLCGAISMTGDLCDYTLDISEHLFHLTTESLRLRSNETRQYQTLASLLDQRIFVGSTLDEHAPDTIREHLSTVPTKGDIRIHLRIARSSADNLAKVKHRLGVFLGSAVTVGDTLSIMLFHYVVEQKAARILQRIGLDDLGLGSEQPPGCGNFEGNVVKLR